MRSAKASSTVVGVGAEEEEEGVGETSDWTIAWAEETKPRFSRA